MMYALQCPRDRLRDLSSTSQGFIGTVTDARQRLPGTDLGREAFIYAFIFSVTRDRLATIHWI
jgi:hypothetical protein